jgi:hypothetical protein
MGSQALRWSLATAGWEGFRLKEAACGWHLVLPTGRRRQGPPLCYLCQAVDGQAGNAMANCFTLGFLS